MKMLRPYQAAAIDAIRDELLHHESTVAVLPTGLGKTVVAAKLMAEWERGNTLFLAHTRELIDQATDKLEAELGYRPGIEMNVESVELRTLWKGKLVVVGSVQTMYGHRRLARYKNHPFGLIVVDECHHATAARYRKVIDHLRETNPNLKVVGITATPRRADGAALGTMFESVAYELSINEAIDDGWLVPVHQEFVVVDSLSLEGIRTTRNKFGEADFNAEDLGKLLIQQETLHKIALPTLEKLGDRSAIVFTATVRQAHDLAAVLNRNKSGSAAAVDGALDPQRRKEIVRDFIAGKIQFLCNCSVFTEGFDAPNCAAIVMARPTKSLALYTQMLGRGLRPLPGLVDDCVDVAERRLAIRMSEKPACLVLDFVGNSAHKLAGSCDVLGGRYDVETRELAEQEVRRERRDVGELMEQMAALTALEREWKERQCEHLRAREVRYSSHEVDPFDLHAPELVGSAYTGPVRGTATDSQVRLLVNLGVGQERAERFSKRQAGKVIDNLRKTRCTIKQAGILRRHGIDAAGIGMDRAIRIIDAIAQNGWQRPEVLPE